MQTQAPLRLARHGLHIGTYSMAASPLNKLFGSDEVLARLQDHARRLQRLQSVVDRCLPPNFRGLVSVANFNDGILMLHVPSPALATRIKLSGETIRGDLLAMGELVESVQTKVRAPNVRAQAAKPVKRQIGAEGKAALDELRGKLKADDPLAAALARMISRSR